MKTQSITALLCSLLLAAANAIAQDRPAVVEFQTTLGTIAIKPNYLQAPISADNFAVYVNSGFYKNTLVHRAVKNFVIQGGGYGKGGPKTPNDPIVLESTNITGLSNLAGTVAMARTSAFNSATSQYFINLVDNPGLLDYDDPLNPGYAVFGDVVKGMEVALSIANLPTAAQLPFTGGSSMMVVWVEAVYTNTNTAWDSGLSKTRITLAGSGTVTSDPVGINCGTSCNLSQPEGELLSLKAVAATGFVFGGWRGDCKGLRRTIKLDTTTGNHNCTAVFTRRPS